SAQLQSPHHPLRDDISCLHHLENLENQLAGCNKINLRTLLIQDLANCSAYDHKPATRGYLGVTSLRCSLARCKAILDLENPASADPNRPINQHPKQISVQSNDASA